MKEIVRWIDRLNERARTRLKVLLSALSALVTGAFVAALETQI
jgi:hypothetical protein